MKKIIVLLLWLWMFAGFVSASGCFHDHISAVNKAWVITRWANVRNIACMYGSTVIDTLSAGTKVRIIGQTAWTKIVAPDWIVGWVWNNFVSESNDWTNVPAYPTSNVLNDYCDTTDLTHCPNPSAVGVTPTWYYRTVPNYEGSVPVVTTTPTPPTTNLSSAMKSAVDSLVETLMEKLEDKMWDDYEAKKDFLNVLVKKISSTKVSSKVKPIITYLVEQLEYKMTLFYIDSLLDI